MILRQENDEAADLAQARKYALAQDIRLDTLTSLLEEQRQEHANLNKELEASTRSLEKLLGSTHTSVGDLRERSNSARSTFLQLEDELLDHRDSLVSPLSARSQDGPTGARSRTLLETLQDYHRRIEHLENLHGIFGYLAKAEELSLIAKEQIKLPSSRSAVETYCELVSFSHSMYALVPSTSHGLAIAPFVREIASETWRNLTKALEGKLIATLEGLKWPQTKLNDGQLDYVHETRAKAMKTAFMELLAFERTGLEHPLPCIPDSGKQSGTSECLLAVNALAQPLVLRFRYHFDGKRQTNRLDKPEWYFAHVLNALSDHGPLIRGDIQAFLREGGFGRVDAMTDFVTALLRPVTRKIHVSVPQLLGMPSILAHTIYQALFFDDNLRENFHYRPRGHDKASKSAVWKGTADIILGNSVWFTGWRDAEQKFTDDRYYEIIGSAEAWHINEDFAASTSNTLRPTNSALRVRDLFDQVTDRYRALPGFKLRLAFFTDIQLHLLDGYLQRISSATDAFETLSFGLMRAVPGSLAGDAGANARLTNGVNGLQRLIRAGVSASWMEGVCKEWSEDVFFLDMWQEIKEKAAADVQVRTSCAKLLNRAWSKGDSVGLLDEYIEQFHVLSARIEDLIVKHINREVLGELKSYLGRRWDAAISSDGSGEVSPDLASAITVFSALLSALGASLPALALNRLYRAICAPLQDLLVTRGVLPKVWSERGGKQFLLDVEHGWISAARDALGSKVRRPENGLRRLLDAAKLVSLPASTGGGIVEGQIPIARVVQVTWDDGNDSAFLETLEKIGVKELNNRKEVKAILRKRPECWR